MSLLDQQNNDHVMGLLSTPEGQAQLSEGASQFIKTELQESAFNRAILPQENITVADCQRNVNDNSLYVIRDIEPDVAALAVDNLGEPDGQYVKGTRYIIPIVNFVTKRFQITVEDLRAYQYRITKRIEEKSTPLLEKLEDKLFLKLCAAALSAQGAGKSKIIKGASADALTLHEKDFVNIKNTMISGINGSDPKRKEIAVVLMAQEAYNTAVSLPNASDNFGKDRVIGGIDSDTLYGTKIIKTIKSDLLPAGHIWGFTAPDFFGHSFSLGDPQFEIRSQFGLVEWQTKESVGMGIGNIQSMTLLALKGSVAPGVGTNLECSTIGTVDASIAAYYKAAF